MDDVFESVVAENRNLRKEVKTLRERVSALESSRWWQLHPRFLMRRLLAARHEGENGAAGFASASKVKRVARSWRLKAEYQHRNEGREADEIVVRDGIRFKVHPEARGSLEEFCYGSPEQVEELDAFIRDINAVSKKAIERVKDRIPNARDRLRLRGARHPAGALAAHSLEIRTEKTAQAPVDRGQHASAQEDPGFGDRVSVFGDLAFGLAFADQVGQVAAHILI